VLLGNEHALILKATDIDARRSSLSGCVTGCVQPR